MFVNVHIGEHCCLSDAQQHSVSTTLPSLGLPPITMQISFPIANMECGGASCNGKGRFKVVAFGALSRFDGNGNAVTDYKKGVEQLANTVPSDDIFYGERGSSDCRSGRGQDGCTRAGGSMLQPLNRREKCNPGRAGMQSAHCQAQELPWIRLPTAPIRHLIRRPLSPCTQATPASRLTSPSSTSRSASTAHRPPTRWTFRQACHDQSPDA